MVVSSVVTTPPAQSAPVAREVPFAKKVSLTRPKSYTFIFSLWDADGVLAPGTAVWYEEKTIKLTSAVLSTQLGSVNPFTNGVGGVPVDFSQQYWIQVERVVTPTKNALVGGRTRLNATAVALWSASSPVVSSGWVTAGPSADVVIDGTCLRQRELLVPELTQEVLDTSVIQVYFRIGSIGPYLLPYISDAGGPTNQIQAAFKPGKILLNRHTFNTCRFNSGVPEAYPGQPVLINLPQSLEYRWVIIPRGTVVGAAPAIVAAPDGPAAGAGNGDSTVFE
jgi:hypothetical protein